MKKTFLLSLLLMIVVGTKAQINIIDLNAVFQSDSIDQARLVVQYESPFAVFVNNWNKVGERGIIKLGAVISGVFNDCILISTLNFGCNSFCGEHGEEIGNALRAFAAAQLQRGANGILHMGRKTLGQWDKFIIAGA